MSLWQSATHTLITHGIIHTKLYHVHPGIYTVHTPPKTQPNHVSLAISHSHFDHTWHNPQFELTAQLKYLWPNLRLNSKSNPLFKTIQIDLYDPLRIQHESLPAKQRSRSEVTCLAECQQKIAVRH
eukprot:jgi/Chrzof1/8063/UNPLg00108.t1